MADKISGEVDRLLSDRQKYATWLSRLESERTTVSERAFGRVHEDYRKRLAEVDQRLKAHTQSIQGRLEEIQAVVSELEAKKASKVEDLEEARLRRSVGEFRDEGEWTKLEAGLVSAVEDTERRLSSAHQEIERLSTILDQVKSAGTKAGERAKTVPESASAGQTAGSGGRPDRTTAPAGGGAEVDGEESASVALTENGRVEDEGAGARPLPEEEFAHAPPEPTTSADAGVASQASGAGEGEELEDELAFLESLSLDSGDELDSLVFLEEKGRGQTQTVICPHCSAANDPAEWYCTECGEELPAE